LVVLKLNADAQSLFYASHTQDQEEIMTKLSSFATLGLAAAGLLAGAAPAVAATPFVAARPPAVGAASDMSWQHNRDRRWREHGRYGARGYSGRAWRGRDGRYYCRRNDGTTGLLVGGAVGGLVGNGIAGRGDRTLGTVLGAAGGALLGREIDRSGSRCR
jgi:hypothetical protein